MKLNKFFFFLEILSQKPGETGVWPSTEYCLITKR